MTDLEIFKKILDKAGVEYRTRIEYFGDEETVRQVYVKFHHQPLVFENGKLINEVAVGDKTTDLEKLKKVFDEIGVPYEEYTGIEFTFIRSRDLGFENGNYKYKYPIEETHTIVGAKTATILDSIPTPACESEKEEK